MLTEERKKELDEKFKNIEWIDVLERIADWDITRSVKIYREDDKYKVEMVYLIYGIQCKQTNTVDEES